jgi:signal peptidase I
MANVATRSTKYVQSHGGDYTAYTTYTMPAGSMLPTIHVGATMLVNRSAYRSESPARGDIVVFKSPLLGLPFVKRVVAVPGDRFTIARGVTYVNGRRVEEPYIKERPAYDMALRRVPSGCYIVLGDNRNDSEDSHIFGCVKRTSFIGKVVQVY